MKPEATQQIRESVTKALDDAIKSLTEKARTGIFTVNVAFTLQDGGIRYIKKQTSWEEYTPMKK